MTLPSRNLLGNEISPYLQLHKDEPVHWRPWGADALGEAKALNKPILLSTGYSACHWCHVMAQETYSDPEIAVLLNERFVCIMIDREERPEIDFVYQAALQATGTGGGWPLTTFLTPDADFFAGGTYFPATDQEDGRPGFRTVLGNIETALRDQRPQIDNNIVQVKQTLTAAWHADEPKPIDPNIVDFVSRRATQRMDVFFGGFDGAPKFPNVAVLHLIWRAHMRSAIGQFGAAVANTLDNMCQGGIYDHIGGGFHRYSVDDRWMQPHFEKMLYDNAALIEFMTLVWQHSRAPLYAARVDETVDWVLREMVTGEGAFAAALDSDSDGEEGKFYVWSQAELAEVLGPNEAPFFEQVYGVLPSGNWAGSNRNILHRLNAIPFMRPDQEAVLTRNRRMLQMARARRTRPARDDKLLPDVNGMMIAALAHAGAAFKKPEWHFAAVRAFWALDERLSQSNRLAQYWREQPSANESTADGYAKMAKAALALFEYTNDERYLEKAKGWIERLHTHFEDSGARGGYYLSSSEAKDIPMRVRSAADQATPSYNGVIADVLARLYFLTRNEKYRERSNALIAAFGAEVGRQLFGCATLLNAMELIVNGVQIVVMGDERSQDMQALVRATLERSVPTKLLVQLRPGQKLPNGHPAAGKGMEGGRATAYVVIGDQVSTPVTDPVQLANGLFSQPFQNLMLAQAQQQQAMQAANSR